MFYSNKDYFGFARFNWNFYSDIDIQDIDILVIFIYVDSPGWCVFRGSLQPWVHWTPKSYHISIYLSIYILSYLSIYLSKNSLMIFLFFCHLFFSYIKFLFTLCFGKICLLFVFLLSLYMYVSAFAGFCLVSFICTCTYPSSFHPCIIVFLRVSG